MTSSLSSSSSSSSSPSTSCLDPPEPLYDHASFLRQFALPSTECNTDGSLVRRCFVLWLIRLWNQDARGSTAFTRSYWTLAMHQQLHEIGERAMNNSPADTKNQLLSEDLYEPAFFGADVRTIMQQNTEAARRRAMLAQHHHQLQQQLNADGLTPAGKKRKKASTSQSAGGAGGGGRDEPPVKRQA